MKNRLIPFVLFATILMTLIGCCNTVPKETEAPQTTAYEQPVMTAMSYNLYSADITDARAERVISLIRKYHPDTLGVQEATAGWMDRLERNLGDEYDYVALGRDEQGRGERNAIFYRNDLFKLLDSGTRWLSDTPDTVSKYDASACNRILTYALLERIADGEKILLVNIHLDYLLESVRLKQAKVLSAFLNEYGDYPTVLSGDFNAGPTSSVMTHLDGSGMQASYLWAGIDKVVPTHEDGGFLDYILFSENDFEGLSYHIADEKVDGEYPSDHYPVIAVYKFKD